AEDGIRDGHVTGVQTCALPISPWAEGARDVACPAQTAAMERALPHDGRALQPLVRLERDRRVRRLSALSQALRRWAVARSLARAERKSGGEGKRGDLGGVTEQ